MPNKEIARTYVRDHFISTIELPGSSIFETMVFKQHPNNSWEEKDVQHYASRREAVIGHVVMVGRWKEILQDYPPCHICDDPGNETVTDENEYGDTIDLPICTPCRYKLFGENE